MQASKVTRDVLESAAREIGVTLEMRALNTAGTRFQVKVNPGARDGERFESVSGRKGSPMSKYQRTSASTFSRGRRVHAVCWHGFRDFFRAVYRVAPDATFRTAFDTWKGSEDFESRFRFSGHRNIGSQVAPMMAADACACPDSGLVN